MPAKEVSDLITEMEAGLSFFRLDKHAVACYNVGVMEKEAVIRMLTYEPCILTTEEYERLKREVIASHLADPGTVGNRILAKLLIENEGRYHQAKAINSFDTTL